MTKENTDASTYGAIGRSGKYAGSSALQSLIRPTRKPRSRTARSTGTASGRGSPNPRSKPRRTRAASASCSADGWAPMRAAAQASEPSTVPPAPLKRSCTVAVSSASKAA